MTTPTDHERLRELAERVEALTGPSREVDAEIAAALGLDHGPREKVHYEARSITYIDECAARFTASLDAAMTLVPEGWKLRQMNFSAPCADDRKWHLNLHGGREGEDTFVGRGASPTLALTAAALRARANA